ncbi:hypothetical protein [Spirosoma koreense]
MTGLTAHELPPNYRLKQVTHRLRSGFSVRETAYQVGSERAAYFSKCFQELCQARPSEAVAQG